MPYAAYQHHPTIYDTCPTCGGPKTKGALVCRKCKHDKAPSWATCACGTRIRAAYQQCRPCYDKEREAVRPTCVDCGTPTKRYAHEYAAERCWPCEVRRRRDQPVHVCSVDGCEAVHMAKGFCRNHYRQEFQSRRRTRAGGQLIQWLKTMPCQICGYARMKSEAARLTPGGPYRPGNVMALCVRCHREVDADITPAVTPPTADEILEWAASKGLV